MKVVEQAILSTDLALYFRKKDRFLETANCGEIDWQEQEKKECKQSYFYAAYNLYFQEVSTYALTIVSQPHSDPICVLVS